MGLALRVSNRRGTITLMANRSNLSTALVILPFTNHEGGYGTVLLVSKVQC